MTQQIINVGVTANDKTGDTIRSAFTKVNTNFTELYANFTSIVQIPSQTGNSGLYLTTNGIGLSWASGAGGGASLPSLTGNTGKFLTTTDGINASWGAPTIGASTLTGNTLASTVINSNLSSLGTLTGLSVQGNATISNNLTIGGNLVVTGTTTSVNQSNLSITNSLVFLANNNSSNSVDIGMVGTYNSTYYTGLVKHVGDGYWYLFSGETSAISTTINISDSTFSINTLKANLIGSVTGNATTVTNGVYTTGSYSDPSWITSLSSTKVLPTQTVGLNGYYLTTNGSVAAWTAFPVASTTQTGGVKVDGTTITINGSGVISAAAGTTVPALTGNTGKYLTNNGTNTSWQAFSITTNTASNSLSALSLSNGIWSYTPFSLPGAFTLTNNAVIKDTATNALSFGNQAGLTTQGTAALALGYQSGQTQGNYALSIGYQAGQTSQSAQGIAIGTQAGSNGQNTNAIAIGSLAGQTTQGQNSIAIGYNAGVSSQVAGSIIINATGSLLNAQTNAGLYAAPIRNDATSTTNFIFYNTSTKELTYSTVSTLGSVQSVSVASANGFAGTVATSTSTPAITITTSVTGLLKGNGSSVTAAVGGTDYQTAQSVTGIVKSSGTTRSAAVAGTDYLAPNSISVTTNAASGNGSLSYNNGVFTFTPASAGSGTVTAVSVASANGFAGTVATSTSTPAITITTSITGLLKGNGSALSSATSGTDYAPGTSALATGIVKSTTSTGALTIAVAGTDYLAPNSISVTTNAASGNGSLIYNNGVFTFTPASAGSGTVTAVSVASANGFAGTVATSTSTPAITITTSITGLLKGNGSAVSAATAGTDYQAPITITGLAKGSGVAGTLTAATAGTDYLAPPSGTSILKANSGGALANAVAGTDYQAPIGTIVGIVKGNGANALTAAVSGTDYAPATSGTGLLKGNGSGGFSTASAGVDYAIAQSVTGIVKSSGTTRSAATSGTDYAPGTSALATGIVKSTTSTGALSIAVAGTDYIAPYTSQTANYIFAAPSGSAGTPVFRAMTSADLPIAGVSILGAVKIGTGISIAGDGTISVSVAGNENANTFYAGPTSGGATNPTFRTIVAADIPTLNQNTTGTAAAIAGGAARQIVYQTAAGTSGFISAPSAPGYLQYNGSGFVWATTTSPVINQLSSSTYILAIDSNGNIALNNGASNVWGVGNTGIQSYYGSTSGSVAFQAPAVAGSQSYTWPTAVPGTNGYVLSATTAGVMSWVAQPTIPTYTVTTGSASGNGALSLTGTTFTFNPASIPTYTVSTAAASGSGALSLSGTTFTFTPPALSNYATLSNTGQIFTDTSGGTNYSLKIANGSTGSVFGIGTGNNAYGIANDALNNTISGYVPYTVSASTITFKTGASIPATALSIASNGAVTIGTLAGLLKGTAGVISAAAASDINTTFGSQTQNYVYAAPSSSAGTPTFRALVATDIPALNQNTSGTAAGLSVTLIATSGGTGQSSYTIGDILYASTPTALSKLAAGPNTYVLTSNGAGSAPSWAAPGIAAAASLTGTTLAAGVTSSSLTSFGATPAMTSPSITTSLTTPSTTFALVNTTATTVNFAGGATTALNIGASNAPVTAFAATATTSSTAASLGYIGMPQQSKSSAYTTVIGDQGKHIYVTATATITIDSNANVAYPIGTTIAFIAGTGATVTIAITSDTMYLGGTGTTGSRTLAAYGMATAVKVAATTWFINGTGLT